MGFEKVKGKIFCSIFGKNDWFFYQLKQLVKIEGILIVPGWVSWQSVRTKQTIFHKRNRYTTLKDVETNIPYFRRGVRSQSVHPKHGGGGSFSIFCFVSQKFGRKPKMKLFRHFLLNTSPTPRNLLTLRMPSSVWKKKKKKRDNTTWI